MRGQYLWGCEQDDIECLYHGGGEAQVTLLIEDVSQGAEDLLGPQQQGQLAQNEGPPSLQQPTPQRPSKPALPHHASDILMFLVLLQSECVTPDNC